MKTYDELYQEYPEFRKEFWEKCKAKDHKRVLFYNSYIKNDSVSDDVIAKRREALERVQDLSVGALLISVVVFAIGILLANEFAETDAMIITAIVLVVHLYTDAVLNHIILEKYRKNLFVLSWWCNELENNGFDASSYRSVINSLQYEVDERYTPQFKGRFINSASSIKTTIQSFAIWEPRLETTRSAWRPSRVSSTANASMSPALLRLSVSRPTSPTIRKLLKSPKRSAIATKPSAKRPKAILPA